MQCTYLGNHNQKITFLSLRVKCLNTYSARPENTRGTLHVLYVPGPKILGDKFPTSNCQPGVYSFAHDRWLRLQFFVTAVSLLKQANISINTYFSFFFYPAQNCFNELCVEQKDVYFCSLLCCHLCPPLFFSSAALTHYIIHNWTFPKRTL